VSITQNCTNQFTGDVDMYPFLSQKITKFGWDFTKLYQFNIKQMEMCSLFWATLYKPTVRNANTINKLTHPNLQDMVRNKKAESWHGEMRSNIDGLWRDFVPHSGNTFTDCQQSSSLARRFFICKREGHHRRRILWWRKYLYFKIVIHIFWKSICFRESDSDIRTKRLAINVM